MDPLAGRIEKDVVVWPGDPVRFRAVLEADQGQLEIHVDLDWSASYLGRKQDYILDYRRQIERYWSECFAIRVHFDHGGQSKTYTVKPSVVLHEVERQQAHYVMKIQNTRYTTSSVTTDADVESFMDKMKRKISGGSEPETKNVCLLAPDDVKDAQDTLKMKVGIKTSHVNNAGWGYSDTVWKEACRHFAKIERTVAFAPKSVEPQSPGALPELVQEVGRAYQNAVQADLPLVPLLVTGQTVRGEDRSLASKRAGRVIGAIAAHLGSLRLAGIRIANAEKHDAPQPVAAIAVGDGFKTFKSGHAYPIAAHEFGHMLGLLDEYFPADHPQNVQDSPRYLRYCESHGLERPDFGKNSLSIMSMGDRVKPCHYVPFMIAIDRVLEDQKAQISTRALGKAPAEKLAILDEYNLVNSAKITIV